MLIKRDWVEAARQLALRRHLGDSSGHDPYHVQRVVKMALQIANYEKVDDMNLIELIAWLHDIDDRKLSKTDTHLSVRDFCQQQQIPDELSTLIQAEIDALSYSSSLQGKSMQTLEGQIVQDADRLDAIGAIGIARVFAYGGSKGRPIDDVGQSGLSSLDHFYDKLFKLEHLMNTPYAKKWARERTNYMEEFVQRLISER